MSNLRASYSRDDLKDYANIRDNDFGAEKKQTTRFASLLRYASLRSADASLQGRLLLHLSTFVIVPYTYSLRPSNHHRI